MKIFPMTISKINPSNICRLSCVVTPTNNTLNKNGNLIFCTENGYPLATCPLLNETRYIEFKTPHACSVFVKNTYDFSVQIDNIKVNDGENIIHSFTVDMYADSSADINSDVCFIFLLTNNHAAIIEELALKSLYTYGNYNTIPVVIAGFSLAPKIKNRLLKYNCKIIDFFEHEDMLTAGHKMSLWMLPRMIHSNYFAIMDCDLLFGDDINGLFDVLHSYPEDKIFCNPWNTSMEKYYMSQSGNNLEYVNKLQTTYDIPDDIFNANGYINAGFYIMARTGALNIDSLTQTYHDKINSTKDFYFTEELVLNTCARRLNNIVLLPNVYNYPVTDSNELNIYDNYIEHNGVMPKVIHLLSSKIDHIYKVKQKVNWKINLDNVYKM